jgi:Bucentaur or craniofacial development
MNNIESLLQQLDDTKKVSTITKTAMDWEQYKEQTNLKETLEHHTISSSAYLPKQDFLHRVDIRKYDHEKQQRLLVSSSSSLQQQQQQQQFTSKKI